MSVGVGNGCTEVEGEIMLQWAQSGWIQFDPVWIQQDVAAVVEDLMSPAAFRARAAAQHRARILREDEDIIMVAMSFMEAICRR